MNGVRQLSTQLLRHRWAWLLFAFILAWRLFQVRTLALPAWVDSVHHTLLVRILLEQGQIPDTWAPYLSQVPFYYHFGFHVTAASFAWLTGLTEGKLGQAVLITGQIWQAVLALGVYALSWTLWKKQEKALIAMSLVGFVSQMPAYYVTWGRYSLLAGLALMILAMAAALARRSVILALLVAATAITHHYAFFLLGIFLALLIGLDDERRKPALIGGCGGLLLAGPWLWRVLVEGQHLIGVQTSAAHLSSDPLRLWSLLGPSRNYFLLVLAGVGMGVLIVKLWRAQEAGNTGVFSFMGWTCMLLILMGPWGLGPFRPDHAAIVLFLPTVLLATEGLSQLRWSPLIWSVVLVLVVQGLYETKDIVRDDTILATTEDVTALTWIEEHTPADAVFLIDVAPWFGVWRGVDGGWWITPLTGRRTTLPPLAYGWDSAAAIQSLGQLAEQTASLAHSQDAAYCQELATISQATGATYYYTRSTRPIYCATAQLVYQGQGGIDIYQFNPVISNQGGAKS